MESNNQVVVEERRSKNYVPAIWTPQLIRSFKSPYNYETHKSHLEELKQNAKSIFASTIENYSNAQITQLIDTIQQLGIAHHLKKEIMEALDIIYLNINNETDLSNVALEFRILRGYGFLVSSDMFNKFIDEKSGIFFDKLKENVEGLINLYEASFLGMDGEDHVLDEAKTFSKTHLILLMEKTDQINTYVSKKIRESLSVPLHWRMPTAEVRGFIDAYEKSETMNKVFLQLAKLNFNLIQSVYLNEIQELANWWEELNFKEKLPFARDRLMEGFIYAVGSVPDPQFSRARKNVAKSAILIVVLDDIYDTHGFYDELQQLTDVIDRWDTKAMEEELPEYMRIWCSALLAHVDEIVQDGFDDLNIDIRPYIQELWKTLTKTYLLEAKWYYENVMPGFDEYIENGWVSVALPLVMVVSYFGLIPFSQLPIGSIVEYFELWCRSDLFYLTSLICRLIDDLGSSKGEMEIGEMTNAIQCYMVQEGATEDQAKDHIWNIISDLWRKINKLIFQNTYDFPGCTANITLDHTRCAIRIYKYVDLFAAQAEDNEKTATSLFFHPI